MKIRCNLAKLWANNKVGPFSETARSRVGMPFQPAAIKMYGSFSKSFSGVPSLSSGCTLSSSTVSWSTETHSITFRSALMISGHVNHRYSNKTRPIAKIQLVTLTGYDKGTVVRFCQRGSIASYASTGIATILTSVCPSQAVFYQNQLSWVMTSSPMESSETNFFSSIRLIAKFGRSHPEQWC